MSQIAEKPRNCDKRGGILVVMVPGLVFPLSCTHITSFARIWSRVREGTFTVEWRWRTKRFMSMNRHTVRSRSRRNALWVIEQGSESISANQSLWK